ncbi:hypothetical protein B9Q04_01930 [Candidatus Marsarchaeota G2 archaeon BE_D]|uniref:Uncharacterized protein n=1 Tax=Candidatus Marsarchaeota G2 archaeon BE_D TaxID=1978158 RepID=A0A2R6CE18_9ARCH|nr:MAG: hypothetical protein B9Q04_01930 [Candidatus Marsarchaeota G2 archaeon BE_D]
MGEPPSAAEGYILSYHLFLVGTLLDFVSGFVALLVSYYAYRYNRLLRSTPLLFLSFGFMLLGLGLLSEASIHLFSAVYTRQLRIFVEASAVYLVMQVAAYLVIAMGYAYEAYRRGTLSPTAASLLLVGVKRPPVLLLPYRLSVTAELLSVIILAVVVYQATLVYTTSKNRFAGMVLTGFLLIMLGQAISLGGVIVLSTPSFEIGELTRFLGFLVLLVFLLRSGRSGQA